MTCQKSSNPAQMIPISGTFGLAKTAKGMLSKERPIGSPSPMIGKVWYPRPKSRIKKRSRRSWLGTFWGIATCTMWRTMATRKRRFGSLASELVKKAREAMLSAVQIYNNPHVEFKSELFIVTTVIAWTYLLHSYYRKRR